MKCKGCGRLHQSHMEHCQDCQWIGPEEREARKHSKGCPGKHSAKVSCAECIRVYRKVMAAFDKLLKAKAEGSLDELVHRRTELGGNKT